MGTEKATSVPLMSTTSGPSPSPAAKMPTLSNWRLSNDDVDFDNESYLEGLEEFVREGNEVVDRVIDVIPVP